MKSGSYLVVSILGTTPLLAYTFAAAGYVHETLLAATKIWTENGFDLGPGCGEATQAWVELVGLEEKHILEILHEIAQTATDSKDE
jgi:hypothetical protein